MSISIIKALNDVSGLSWQHRACLKAIAEYCREGKKNHRVKYSTVRNRTGIPESTLGRAVKAGIETGCLFVRRTGRSNDFQWHVRSASRADQKPASGKSTIQEINNDLVNADPFTDAMKVTRRDDRSLTEKVIRAHAIASKAGTSTAPADLLRLVGISRPTEKQVEATRRILSTSSDQQTQRNDARLSGKG